VIGGSSDGALIVPASPSSRRSSATYWCAIAPGRHLGYRRIGKHGGTWIAKLRLGDTGRWTHALGAADDAIDQGNVLTFAEAQERARAWFAEQERQATGEPAEAHLPALTVEDVVNDYLDWTAKHRRPTTAREWRYMARAHVLPALGKFEIAKLTTTRLRTWHEGLADQPRRLRTRPGAEQRFLELVDDPDAIRARRATANRNLTVLKAALNHAWQSGKIRGSDEAWRRVKPFRGADAARVRYLQIDECTRLLNWIPLDDEAVDFFDAITAGRAPNEPLFVRADGGRWGKSHQRRPLLEACKAARIEPAIGFHVLRHTWASLRIMAGLPLMVAAQVLGHSDTRMVEKHYGHLAQSYIRDAVRSTALRLGPIDSNVAHLRPAAG